MIRTPNSVAASRYRIPRKCFALRRIADGARQRHATPTELAEDATIRSSTARPMKPPVSGDRRYPDVRGNAGRDFRKTVAGSATATTSPRLNARCGEVRLPASRRDAGPVETRCRIIAWTKAEGAADTPVRTDDPAEAVKGADPVVTDTWIPWVRPTARAAAAARCLPGRSGWTAPPRVDLHDPPAAYRGHEVPPK